MGATKKVRKMMRTMIVPAALLTAAMSFTTGTAGADAARGEVVNYTATTTQESTIITTDAGSLVDEDGVFKIKSADGAVLAGTELSFRVDDFVFPIAAEIRDRSATLTPQFDLAHAVYKPVALPFENQAPWKSEY
ncbi:hypothetical protein ACWDTH_35305, partial [Nocardia xishanensis]